MEIKLVRKIFTDKSTIGELYVDGVFECHVLEDVDRGLISTMPLEEIKKIKVYGQTCIPYGKYKVTNTYSSKFKQYLPLLMNVPGYLGIRIHAGNTAVDTLGCLLPGKYNPKIPDFVSSSRVSFNSLMRKISKIEKKEPIVITIAKD